QQQEHAHHAMVGGRIEAIKQGTALARVLFLYDKVSAYPSGMLELPSMRDGKWIYHGPIQSSDIERVVASANILSMFRVKWAFPGFSPKFGRDVPFYPFPYRTKRRAILFASQGHAWIMRDELLAAINWAKTFGFDIEKIEVEEWDEFIPGN